LTEICERRIVASMTLQEFEKFRISVERQKFQAESLDPLHYGIQRDEFKKARLAQLIAAGVKVDSKTVAAKISRWKRQLLRLDQSQARLEKLRQEIAAGKLQVTVPDRAVERSSRPSARI
jgi:hypothetical protein